jgi:murein DD-endopeptidase MepM/ murein hydrolase activator NlpD
VAVPDGPLTLDLILRLRLLALCAFALVPLLLWAGLPLVSSGQSLSEVQSKIQRKRAQIEEKKGKERVLTSDIAAFTSKINRLEGEIGTLEARQAELQGDLDAKRAELIQVQDDLRAERARLTRLKARLVEAKRALADRLVELYKADEPDLITIVLVSADFAELLERGEFLRRISESDQRIVENVREAKAETKATADRLAELERRKQEVAAAIMARRDEVIAVKEKLESTQATFAAARADKRQALATVRTQRTHLEGDLAELEKVQARIQARLAGVATSPAGPIRQGSGSMVWPVNGPIVSPFGPRWGRMHNGVDIAVPAGTPIRAVDDGTVVLIQSTYASGGYGNFTCVSHGGALSSCYAHQSSFATSMGANVSKGQVIGYVGCTGHCYGDHLHFEIRINGGAVDPMGYL